MEEDRARADLGEAFDAEINAESHQKLKEPRKRFIGRKEAAERAEKRGTTNGTIEDSGAIQSMPRRSSSANPIMTFYSFATKEDG